MSTRKSFEKVTSDSPSRKDMPRVRDSKVQPREASAGEPCPKGPIGNEDHWNDYNKLHKNKTYTTQGNFNGDAHDFNIKGKSVSTADSDYHSFGRKTSGLHGNFAEKDASLEYLRDRNKQGIDVNHFSGTSREARLKIGHGMTAYDGRPIPEVYKPATSQGQVPPNAVQYKTEVKTRQPDAFYVQDTESNKLKQKIAKHLETK